MSRSAIIGSCVFFLMTAGTAFVGASSGPAPESSFVPGELLVRLQTGVTTDEIQIARARFAATYIRTLLSGDVELWRVPVGLEEIEADLLSREPSVLWAEPNYIYHAFSTTPNDPSFGAQWGHARIHSTTAWDTETGSDQIVIAIVDTGADTGHPDLAAKMIPGYDFIGNDADPTDLHGHGTHVSGIAAAVTNNAIGIAGTSWGAKIMPVRVLDETGHGANSVITDGITWAAAHGARIINLSLGGATYSQAMQDAVNVAHTAGVLVVAAMGNDRSSNPVSYPAAYDNVFAVAATDKYDNYTYYSQYGPHCDIAAPGGVMSYYHDPDGIYSTLPTYACTMTANGYSLSYDRERGTSMATPFVSGLAALVMSAHPSLGPDQVQNVIESSANDRGPAGWDEDYGWGLIDAAAAIEAVMHVFSDGFESGDTTAWN